MPKSLLTRADVEKRVGLRKSTLYARIADGSFPKPIRIGTKAVRWPSNEIDAWIDAQIASCPRAGESKAA